MAGEHCTPANRSSDVIHFTDNSQTSVSTGVFISTYANAMQLYEMLQSIMQKVFPKQDKSQHSEQRKDPLYSDKHNAAIVVFNVSTGKRKLQYVGVEEFMFA